MSGGAAMNERDRQRILSALRLAVDPAAGDGETLAALNGIVRILKAGKMGVPELLAALIHEAEPRPSQEVERPFGWDVPMPFGKYSRWTLGEIADSDPSYVEWLAEKADLKSKGLRAAVHSVWDWLCEK